MRNHFNSAHRWDYIIISVTGGGHKHYLVSDVVDSNSLYPVKNDYDSKYDGYPVKCYPDSDSNSLFDVVIIVDKSGYYLINNTVNSDSLFVIYNKGDFNR